jgi:outer membrane protein assembly factor BamB
MNNKKRRIILFIATIIALLIGIAGYYMYNFTQGSENLVGNRQSIPDKTSAKDRLSTGNSDWTSWQGENYDKKSQFTGLKKDWSAGLKKLWEVNFLCQDDQTATWSAGVVRGKTLIIPGRDEKNDLVFCLDSETGKLIWKGSCEAPTNTNHGPGARATPVIDTDKVYTYGRGGDLVCWNLADGRILWHKKVADTGGVEPDWGYSSSPLLYGNKVIVQTGGNALAVAYDKINGEVLWKSGTGFGGYAPLNVFTADSSLLLFSGEALSGLNAETGDVYWSVPWLVDYKVNASIPVSEGNIVFVTSGYSKGCMAIEVVNKKAKVLWESHSIEGQHSDPVIVNGYVYGYSGNSSRNNGSLVCLRLSDGKEMWSSKEVGTGTFAFADGYLVCLDINGNLSLVEVNPEKFVLSGRIEKALASVKHPAWTAPFIANGKLYLRYLQSIVCYSLE